MTSTTQEFLDSEPTSEPLSDEEFNAYLNFLANHELKMLVMTLLAKFSRSGVNVTGDEIWGELMHLQNKFLTRGKKTASTYPPSNGWTELDPATVARICEGFEKFGLVKAEKAIGRNGHEVTVYGLDDDNEAGRALTINGILMPWSLRFKDKSTQRLLGLTRTQEGCRRAPEKRYAFFGKIISNNGLLRSELVGNLQSLGFAKSGVRKDINIFKTAGVINESSNPKRPSASRFLSLSDEYRIPLEDLHNDLEAFRANPISSSSIETALTVLSNPESVTILLAKAKKFVPQGKLRQARRDELARRVLEILPQNGPGVTGAEIYDSLEQDGNDISKTTLERTLGSLGISGDAQSKILTLGRVTSRYHSRT